MATAQQKKAAKENIKKAQAKWRSMSSRQKALAQQPNTPQRSKPGSKGKGQYYHVRIRDKNEFVTFRTHDVGRKGHSQRVAGKRRSGSWATQKWLISKEDAYIDDKGYLRSNNDKTKKILKRLGTIPKHKRGDIFVAKPRF